MKSVASRDYLDPTSVKSSRPPSQRSTIDIGGRPPEEDIQEQRYNFLHTILRGVPDIEELSSSSSVEGIKPSSDETIRKKKVTLKPESFVWEEGTQSLDLELESEPPRNSKSPSQVSEISLCSLSDSDEVISYHGEEKSSIFDITESMMNIEPRGTKVHIESSSSSSLEIRMASLEAIENFLDHIITQIVKHAEHPDVRMRLFLDKKKLQEQLYVLAKDYQEEMYKNQSLDRLVTEYYARRKVFSFITQPNRSQAISHAISQRRYKFVLEELDHRLEHMHALEATKEELLVKLQKEEQAGQAILDEKNTKFESKVRSILLKDGFDRLKGVVDDLLKKMVRTRNEVSAVRRDLLFMQHRYAMISTLAEKMECLVNGLSVNQYLSNQAHNDSLVIKIQEKDIELRRLSEVVTYNMHAMAHWKNKETMAKNMLNQLKRRLRQRQEAKKQCRDRLHKEVLRHKRLKKEQQNLRKMGCLMHYPALLKDFDASVDFSDNKRKVVNKLWVEYDRLERRCNAVEKDTLSASFLLGTSTSPPRGTRNNSRTVVGF
nr:uncharacterized protein LOC108132210 [Drosophila bipectinata]